MRTIDESDKKLWHFFTSYVGAALWSSIDSGGEPLGAGRDISDVAPATLEAMAEDCRRFYTTNRDAIHCEGAPLAPDFDGPLSHREAAQAGHDFWLTRAGHGAGFWDSDWPESAASQLDNASRHFGSVELYVGDDGLVYA